MYFSNIFRWDVYIVLYTVCCVHCCVQRTLSMLCTVSRGSVHLIVTVIKVYNYMHVFMMCCALQLTVYTAVKSFTLNHRSVVRTSTCLRREEPSTSRYHRDVLQSIVYMLC